jgi:hypothetical protein
LGRGKKQLGQIVSDLCSFSKRIHGRMRFVKKHECNAENELQTFKMMKLIIFLRPLSAVIGETMSNNLYQAGNNLWKVSLALKMIP